MKEFMKNKKIICTLISFVLVGVIICSAVFVSRKQSAQTFEVIKGSYEEKTLSATQNYTKECVELGTLTNLDEEQMVALASAVTDASLSEFNTVDLTDEDIERLINTINTTIDMQIEGYGVELTDEEATYLRDGLQAIVLTSISTSLAESGNASTETMQAIQNALGDRATDFNTILSAKSDDVLQNILVLEQLLNNVSSSTDDKSASLENMQAEMEELKKELANAGSMDNSTVETLKNAIRTLETQISVVYADNSTDLASMQADIEVLKKAVNDKDLTTAKATTDKIDDTLQKTVDAQAEEIKSLSEDIVQVSDTLKTSVKSLQTAQSNTEELLKTLQINVDENLTDAIAENNEELQAKLDEISESLSNTDANLLSLNTSQTEALNSAKSDLQSAIDTANTTLSDANKDISDLQTSLATTKSDLQSLDTVVNTLQSDVSGKASQSDLDNANTGISRNAGDIASLDSAKADKTALDTSNSNITKNAGDISENANAISQNAESIEQNARDISENASNISSLQSEKANQEDLDDLSEEVDKKLVAYYTIENGVPTIRFANVQTQ